MLSKLIKYEFKATSRFMLLMYLLFSALSVILSLGIRFNVDGLINTFDSNFGMGATIFRILSVIIIYLFIIMNIVVLSGMFFYSIKRFKDNLLGNEGYLMHTLPVKTRDNILAKNIVSVIWTILSFIVVGISYFIMIVIIGETEFFEGLLNVLKQINWGEHYVTETIIILCEFVVMFILALVNMYFHIYASMAVGYSFDTHRAAKSIGVYILINIAANMLEGILMRPFEMFAVTEGDIFYSFNIFACYSIVATAITGLIYYFIAHYFMSKRLNLL